MPDHTQFEYFLIHLSADGCSCIRWLFFYKEFVEELADRSKELFIWSTHGTSIDTANTNETCQGCIINIGALHGSNNVETTALGKASKSRGCAMNYTINFES
ncbi:hypothetical protein T10_3575 [Trichinella papuae]|uniref:Uncharacterized protein n=1 Tax=Trichinella papuae TaxID=268474 RepID=A0A0V1N4X0_9BILA|nr:hypothetical protein T10_3575 [Trichinella papuae]